MSTLDVVAEILREVAPRALKARELVGLAGGRLPTSSRTPETVVSRDLAIDVKRHGASSRFLRASAGEFLLKEALPTAFYNDNEAYVAQWTRNLIAANEIAAGVVDERSIRDLQPADVAGYRQFHAFSGIGTWSRALRDAGWPDDVNVWSGSCPCGPWSQAGQKRGFDDERHLWPEWFRLIRACRPAVVLGEQVASKDGLAWLDAVHVDLEGADYTIRALDLCAAGVGAPHLRQRLYFVAVARERGREIGGAAWLRRGQLGDVVAGRGTLDGIAASVALPDAAGARRHAAEDAIADRGDARKSDRSREWGAAGDLEPERGGTADGPGAVSDAERELWHAGWTPLALGWAEGEPDRHGEAHGADVDVSELVNAAVLRCEGGKALEIGPRNGGTTVGGEADVGAGELGDAGRDGAGEHDRELRRDEAQHEERSSQGDHASLAAGAAYGPGDRVRIDGDPSWGGAVRGFWAVDVEWIYCRPTPGHEDGCWRPAQSGTQPLVVGPAPGVGRTRAKRLRGYGNGICLPLAAIFIEAVIDALVDDAGAWEAAPTESKSRSRRRAPASREVESEAELEVEVEVKVEASREVGLEGENKIEGRMSADMHAEVPGAPGENVDAEVAA